MAVHAVFTLGLRDVRYNVGTTEPRFLSCDFKGNEDAELAKYLACEKGARPIALKLHERLKADRGSELNRFCLPIITPCLEYLSSEDAADALQTITFVVTDQPERVPKRITDSINMVPLCKDLLQAINPALSSVTFRTLAVMSDPHLDASAYRQVGQQLPSLLPPKEGDRYYMFLSGGIQSVAQALKQHGLRLYGEAWIPCQVEEPRDPAALYRGESSPLESVKALDRGNPFLEDALMTTVRTLVEQYDYYAALQVWRSSLLGTSPLTDKVEPLLKHAVARLNYDFDDAYTLAPTLSPDLNPESRTLPIELREIRDGAAVALEQGQLVQFIVRVATFYENCMRFLDAKLTGDDAWLRDKEVPSRSLVVALGTVVGLKASPTPRHTFRIDREILKAVANTNELYKGKPSLNTLRTLLGRLDRVYDFRNDVLHRMESVTSNSVKNETGLRCKDIMKLCDQVLDAILPSRGSDVYSGVKAELLRQLTFTFERS